MTQRSPSYSAVSALLTKPLPDRSNYSPLLSHPLPHSGSILSLFRINTKSLQDRPFTKPLRWRLILHCCSALLQNLVGNSGDLEEAEQQAEASVDVPYPPLQIVNSVLFCVFSLYYPLSLNPLSSPSPPSLLSLLIKKTSSSITFCFTNGTYFCILFHTMTYFFNNAFYKKTKFWCLSSNLSYPEELKKQWLHCRVGSRKF